MGEVVKFRRTGRRTRASLPTQPGTLILFTGVWRGRLADPEALQPPLRGRSAKAAATRPSNAARAQQNSAATDAVPDEHSPKRGGRARASRRNKISS